MLILGDIKRSLLLVLMLFLFSACSTTGDVREEAGGPRKYKEISLHFIDVGKGDSTLINLPDGGRMLIDAGSPAAGPDLAKYLRSVGVRRIDHLVFTHPHDDHIGGVFNIMSDFEVGRIYDNGFSNFESTIFGDYLESVRSDLSGYRILQAGERLSFGELRIDVMNPMLPPVGRHNDDSIVLSLQYGDIRVLLSGDMGVLGEKRLLKTGVDLKSHVLKVGHHGADDACSEEFLAASAPQAAVITVSEINRYARPEQGALDRLEAAGIKVYRTDRNGHIVMRTDGRSFSLKTERPFNGDNK